MPWLKVRAKKMEVNEDLMLRGIEPNNVEFSWTNDSIRSEDISEFYEVTPSTIMLEFYDERPKMIVKDTVDNFFSKIEHIDYEMEIIDKEEC